MAGAAFTKRMRKRTQTIHNLSDSLVNLKLGATLSNETVWSEGILTFSAIFKYLEEALERSRDSLLGDLDVAGLRRSEAFDSVLRKYFGDPEWKVRYNEMKNSPAVANYLKHLEKIETENPHLLSAYVYHLYMGLLSGGQILSLRRSDKEKDDIFKFEAPHTVSSLKKALRAAMEEVAKHLDEQTQELILQEGITVFKLNNTLIRSVKGVDDAFRNVVKWLLSFSSVLVVMAAVFLYKFYN